MSAGEGDIDTLAAPASAVALGTDATLAATAGGPAHPADEMQPGEQLGAFTIERRLGAGAMGVVMLARDPELNRKVAIKLLTPHRHADEAAAQRLLREAQSAAGLSHPNVVAVHQVATAAGRIFLVMEYVDGGTLRQWVDAGPRSVDEIVAVYRQAGEGLAAAHARGLVHRDFKPDNVLIGRDGRVRVTDFGLVGSFAGADLSQIALRGDAALTQTGALLGTPAYMAPEQFAGSNVDARADQFAFCVSLYEALYGHRPYHGESAGQLLAAMTAGRIEPPPAGRKAAAALHGAVMRGLAADPARRHESMRALLWAIDTAGARPGWGLRAKLALAAGGTAVVAVSGGVGVLAVERGWVDSEAEADAVVVDVSSCGDPDATLAAVFGDDRAQAIVDRFASTGRGDAAEAAQYVLREVEAFSQAWRTAWDEACAAEQPQRDHRLACLEQRLHALEAIGRLAPQEVEAAVDAAAVLPVDLAEPAACEAEARPPPDDAALAQRLSNQAVPLARAQLRARLADLDGARTLAQGVIAALERQVPTPQIAGARLVVARGLAAQGNLDEAQATLQQALHDATRADAPWIEAQCWMVFADILRYSRRPNPLLIDSLEQSIVRTPGRTLLHAEIHGALGTVYATLGRPGEAEQAYSQALAALGDRGGALRGALLGNRGAVRHQLGRFADAEADLMGSLETLSETVGANHPMRANALIAASEMANGLGRVQDARLLAQQAVLAWEAVRGADHFDVARPLTQLGQVAIGAGRHADAVQVLRRALSLVDAKAGFDPAALGTLLLSLGQAELFAGELDSAYERLERARGIVAGLQAPDPTRLALVDDALAAIHSHRGEYDDAYVLLERALKVRENALGAKHSAVAGAHTSLGENRQLAGKCKDAVVHTQRALHVREVLGLSADPDLARALSTIGLCELRMGHLDGARASIEQALALVGPGVAPQLQARVHTAGAQLRWVQDRHAEARGLMESARDRFTAAGPLFEPYARDAQRWLKRHAM